MGAERINAVKTSFFGKGALSLLPAELKKMGIRRGLIVKERRTGWGARFWMRAWSTPSITR